MRQNELKETAKKVTLDKVAYKTNSGKTDHTGDEFAQLGRFSKRQDGEGEGTGKMSIGKRAGRRDGQHTRQEYSVAVSMNKQHGVRRLVAVHEAGRERQRKNSDRVNWETRTC